MRADVPLGGMPEKGVEEEKDIEEEEEEEGMGSGVEE